MSLGGKLTALGVRKLSKPGVYPDGGRSGLYLQVTGEAGRSWLFRYKHRSTGKTVWLGLGPARDVSLAEAREKAQDHRREILNGVDPREAKQAATAARLAAVTFREAAEHYISERESSGGWLDPRAAPVWRSSFERMAYPKIGALPVSSISTDDVLAVLRPVWVTKNDTAGRVRARIETVLNHAARKGWRQGENPARWRGHLDIEAALSARSVVQHHAALALRDIASVMDRMAQSQGMGALAVRFTCLTATRSGEVRRACWGEFNLADKLWTIPATRMKAKREHRVPLSPAALAILGQVGFADAEPDSLVFPGGRAGRPLSDVALSKALHAAAGTKDVTVHGLRSVFRDWCGDVAEVPREIAEAALAHVLPNKVEAAYRRGDALTKRAALMADWATFCAAPVAPTAAATAATP